MRSVGLARSRVVGARRMRQRVGQGVVFLAAALNEIKLTQGANPPGAVTKMASQSGTSRASVTIVSSSDVRAGVETARSSALKQSFKKKSCKGKEKAHSRQVVLSALCPGNDSRLGEEYRSRTKCLETGGARQTFVPRYSARVFLVRQVYSRTGQQEFECA